MGFFHQLRALLWKNLLVSTIRRPIAFVITLYIIPVALLTVLLLLPTFFYSSNTYGFASPAPIKSLPDTVGGKLAIVQPAGLGPDVQRVVDIFTQQVSSDKLEFLKDEKDLLTACPPSSSTDRTTGCHAAVIFLDSPATTSSDKSAKHAWSYSIRGDSLDDSQFDATRHDSLDETLYMPLQLAINNAIGNSTEIPDTFMFSHSAAREASNRKKDALEYVGSFYTFAIFACLIVVIYQLTRWITEERESGLSCLIDGMGGRPMPLLRVVSWSLTFDMICLPASIFFGIVYWRTVFTSSDAWLLIAWQILLGFAVVGSTVFAASFFHRARVSAIFIAAVFLVLTIATQVYIVREYPEPAPATIIALSMLFPSSNYALFMKQMTMWQIAGQKADLAAFPPGSFKAVPDAYAITQGHLLLGLVAQAIGYPLLAALVEWAIHGVSFSKRSFATPSAEQSKPVATAHNLKKDFRPGFWTWLCCCGRRRPKNAVYDVSFDAYKGQIMCLAGPNGSGKTTTLRMLGGLIRPSKGSISFGASPSQIGICPQQNTLWDKLTVREHVALWSGLKSGVSLFSDVDAIIETCNLSDKRDSPSRALSGGQKRKLQLACMFVGDPSICLIDECTSGLDPLSRRVIWDTLLKERRNRSIIFTTHFLDEVDVLADYIVLLVDGKVKCHGPPAELNNRYGGGYRVTCSQGEPGTAITTRWKSTAVKDRQVYHTPDSHTASELSATLVTSGLKDVTIAGPQFEDVFLNIAHDEEEPDLTKSEDSVEELFEMAPGRTISFARQVSILFLKRFQALPRFWWPYLYVIVLVAAIPGAMAPFLEGANPQKCSELVPALDEPVMQTIGFSEYCAEEGTCDRIVLAPGSANQSFYKVVKNGFDDVKDVNISYYDSFVIPLDGRDEWQKYFATHGESGQSGIYAGSGNNKPVIAFLPRPLSTMSGFEMLNVWSEMSSDLQINARRGLLPRVPKQLNGAMMAYIVFLTLVQAIYPAVFVLYPAIERSSKTTSLQYANGVRRGPTLVAHALFESIFVLVASILTTIFLSALVSWWVGNVWDMLPVLLLYGIATTLIGLMIVRYVAGPLNAFLAAFAAHLAVFAVVVGANVAVAMKSDSVVQGVAFGLGVLFPLANVFRALLLGFNIAGQSCRDGTPRPSSSFAAITGPAVLLLLQVIAFTLLSIWIEGGFTFVRNGKQRTAPADDFEMNMRSSRSNDIEKEVRRVETCGSDYLQAIHVNKAFGTNVAVDDVTLGLSPGEVLALLGPNGAGKSTLVNMIQSELAPDAGQILLCNQDAREVSSRKYLGVCPQHDAIDLLTTRQHLIFYARIKGVKNFKQNVDYLLKKLGLEPHAKKNAAKLSGGNKRKLCLAIALLGAPPVIVLDEPTTAMDAVAKRSFWEIIQSISGGRSILLTTHSMEEADALASRAAIVARKMLAIGTTQELRTRFSSAYHVSILLASGANSTHEEMESVFKFILRCIKTVQLEREMLRGQIRFTMPANDPDRPSKPNVVELSQLLEAYKAELGIEYYSIACPTLENAFLNAIEAHNVEDREDLPLSPVRDRWWCTNIFSLRRRYKM